MQDVAERIGREARRQRLPARITSLQDLQLDQLTTADYAVFVISTTGQVTLQKPYHMPAWISIATRRLTCHECHRVKYPQMQRRSGGLCFGGHWEPAP